MLSIVETIVSSIVPTFLIIGTGFIISRVQSVDPSPLNKITLFILTPSLIIHSIAVTTLATNTLYVLFFAVCIFICCVLLASWAIGVLIGKTSPEVQAFQLTATFGNTGALGIPLADFAFGQVGRQVAVMFAAIHGVAVFTIGLYIAVDLDERASHDSFKRILRYPIVYAVMISLALRAFGLIPSSTSAIMETLGVVGESSIPLMLIILGIQLSGTNYQEVITQTMLPVLFRFILSPLIGISIAVALGFDNPIVAKVFILLTAMPVAVAPVIFATEFADRSTVGNVPVPEYVSTNVLISTLVSIPVLAVLLTALKLGLIL